MSKFSRVTLASALMCGTMLATPLLVAGAAHAQDMSAAPAKSHEETIDQRIAKLHKELKITPDEETNWSGVAGAMRDSAAAMQKLAADKAAEAPGSQTAVDDLKTYEQFAHAHVDGLRNLTTAFETLYASMPDAQKKLADNVFRSFGRNKAPARG